MQDQTEDTEWNDALRRHGIIAPKQEKEITEDEVINMLEKTIQDKQKGKQLEDLNLDELDELEDSEDEEVLLEYRRKRIAEMQALASRERFGHVMEITGTNYVQEVNKAGEGIWVVLHLYKMGKPQCSLINQYMQTLADKYRTVKFIKSISTTCIPGFQDKDVPALFVYFEGDLKKQLIGPTELRGVNLTQDEFEYILGRTGAINTDIKDDPRPKIKDKMFADLADTNDW